MRRWMVPFVGALLFPHMLLASNSDKYLIVNEKVVGIYEHNPNETNIFYPTEAVAVVEQKDDRVLVRRIGDQPSWEVHSKAENEMAKLPLWISASSLIGKDSFHKLNTWTGETHYIWCEGSCDSGDSIDFAPDGSYISVYESSSSTDTERTVGHLYRSGQILWLRPDGNSTQLRGGFLYIRQNGTLCSVAECFGGQ